MIYKYWDDEAVVYNPLSGDAHHLTSVNARLLEILNSTETENDILEILLNDDQIKDLFENREQLSTFIQNLSHEFQKIGLLEN